jgi:hypothetical protein
MTMVPVSPRAFLACGRRLCHRIPLDRIPRFPLVGRPETSLLFRPAIPLSGTLGHAQESVPAN